MILSVLLTIIILAFQLIIIISFLSRKKEIEIDTDTDPPGVSDIRKIIQLELKARIDKTNKDRLSQKELIQLLKNEVILEVKKQLLITSNYKKIK